MVNVTRQVPTDAEGAADRGLWLEQLITDHPRLDSPLVRSACAALQGMDVLGSLELANLIAELNMDDVAVAAGMMYRELRSGRIDHAGLVKLLGEETAQLVRSVHALASTSLLEMSNSKLQDHQQESQVENIKRMLAAMVDDPRVAVIKLAERVMALRRAKGFSDLHRRRIADEALSIFAPLAARLGIAQLKWELEDLAFRYTHEETYKDVAQKLQRKRADREAQVRFLEDRVRGLLRAHGVEAEVAGRAKHIFSIWRKMQTKSVSFDQVHDVSAVRVVVPRLADCYAALGIIHNTWPYMHSEFDDYIANPKENGYQSIHTAVTLPEGSTLEVQIRTDAMHADAELGVCAHWQYKGESDEQENFTRKMEWLRQVMEWHDELAGTENLSTLLLHQASGDRIYVSTPQGHILDLPRQSTVLDFAYRVHTELGHGCRSALVNGQPAALDRPLENSEQVEIGSSESDADEAPRREWLERELGFVRTDRARAKIVAYFRALTDEAKQALGRDLVQHAISVLDLAPLDAARQKDMEIRLGLPSGALYSHLATGQINLFEFVEAYLTDEAGLRQPMLLPAESKDVPRDVLLSVRARNRDGLLYEITQVVQRLGLALTQTEGSVDPVTKEAIISIGTNVSSWRECLKLSCQLRLIRGTLKVTAR